MTEIDGSTIEDILNSPTKETSVPVTEPTAPAEIPLENTIEPELNQDDLPGSIEDLPNLDEKRPSTTLEIGPEGVAMVESTAPPTRLPPLRNSQDGDGQDGYRQNIDIISNFSEVIFKGLLVLRTCKYFINCNYRITYLCYCDSGKH